MFETEGMPGFFVEASFNLFIRGLWFPKSTGQILSNDLTPIREENRGRKQRIKKVLQHRVSSSLVRRQHRNTNAISQ